MQALMLLTKDKKKFFTEKNNFKSLLEFAKTFKAELYVVKTKKAKLDNLQNLVTNLCNPDYCNNTKFIVIKRLFPSGVKTSEEIKSYIKQSFLDRKTVSMNELRERYNEVSKSNLNNYFYSIKKLLELEGHSFQKLNAGEYKLT